MSKTTKNFSVDERMVKEIQAIAKKKNASDSQIICEAIDFYLGHRSIEGTVRAEMAKVNASTDAILKSLLVLAVSIDEASPMKPFIASKIGEQATEDLIRKIQSERARAEQ